MIRYVKLEINIHGLEADEDIIPFLVGWLRESTWAALQGSQKSRFRWRDELEGDLEVEVMETAGDKGVQHGS